LPMVDSFAAPVSTARRAPAISRMRIFFGRKQAVYGRLSRPVRILLGSAVALLVLVAVFAISRKWSSDRLATASKISETSGSVAAPVVEVAKPAETPATATENKEGEAEQTATRGTKEQRRTTRAAQKPKRPSAIKRAWNKFKRKLPF
jgi:hypothetical protein